MTPFFFIPFLYFKCFRQGSSPFFPRAAMDVRAVYVLDRRPVRTDSRTLEVHRKALHAATPGPGVRSAFSQGSPGEQEEATPLLVGGCGAGGATFGGE